MTDELKAAKDFATKRLQEAPEALRDLIYCEVRGAFLEGISWERFRMAGERVEEIQKDKK